jgi:alpha-mannosidase
LQVDNPRVRVLAVKKAEQGDEVVVRLVEMDGRKADMVRVSFVGSLASAREVNGAETPVGPATVRDGALVTSFTPYQPRTFALRLAPAPTRVVAPRWQAVPLNYDQAVASSDGSVGAGRFDSAGRSLPAEMLAREIAYHGVGFKLAPADRRNAVTARGQTIALPEGQFTRVYLLAAADGDQHAAFRVGDTPVDLTIQSWGGYIGQWDNRVWTTREEPVVPRAGQPAPPPGTPPRMRTVQVFKELTPGFVKRAPVAWFASHRHGTDGANEPYSYSYLYAYAIDLPPGAKTLTLPINERIRVLAVTVSDDGPSVAPAHPLYDTLERPPARVPGTR